MPADQVTPIKRELIRREMATRELGAYISYHDDKFLMGDFQKKLCSYLDAFIEAVEQKKSPRLMIFAPPRHGKSEIVSRNFPTYVLGKHPEWEIIAASATDGLVRDFGLWVSNRVNSKSYLDMFPGLELDPSRNSTTAIRTLAKGGYAGVGVGTQVVGKGAEIGIVDDPIAGVAAAYSETEREALYSWYMANMQSRLARGGGMLIMHQRWTTDDLAARLIEASKKDDNASKWTVLSFPAVAVEDQVDLLGRKPGEALHPERWPKEDLIRIKTDFVVNGKARDWYALYQQTPIIDKGNFFTKDSLKFYTHPPEDLAYLACSDYAVSEDGDRDKTAIFVLGVDHKGDIYVMPSYWWGRWGSGDIVEKTISLCKKYDCRQLATEKGPIQKTLRSIFTREQDAQGFHVTLEETARSSKKHEIAHAMRAFLEAGKFWLPDLPDVHEHLVPNLLTFSRQTKGDDDAVDALALGCLVIETIGRPLPPAPVAPKWRTDSAAIYGADIFKKKAGKSGGIPRLTGSW